MSIAVVALAASGCAGVYEQAPTDDIRSGGVTRFNGDWHVVTARSADGRNWLEARSQLGADDNWSDGTERVRYRAWFLPDEFRIDGDHDLLRIEDEAGVLIAEIPLDGGGSRVYERDRGGRSVRARWLSERRFEVERVGRNGRRIRQVFALENRGRQLVVGTEVERDAGTRSYTRVYDRG
jgi:hypothetical protein